MTPEIQNALKLLDAEPGNPDALAAVVAAAEGGGNGKSDPAGARALSESRRLARERGDFEMVVRLLDLELGWEKDPARRAELSFEKGKVLVDELFDESGAEAAFKKALADKPGDESAEDALSQLELVRDNWEKVLAKYLAEAKGSSDKALTSSLHVSIAELLWKRQPGSQEVESNLRKALSVDPKNRKAASHLERLLRQTERWSDLASLLAEREAAAGIAKDDRVANLVSLAELQRDRLSRPDLSTETLRKVLALDPMNPRAIKAVVAALTDDGDWAALVKVYEAALKAKRGGDTPQSLALQAELASVLWQRLGQEEAAEQQFAKIRKAEPANALALEFYREWHSARGEGPKLLQVLQAAQKAEPDPKRRQALAVEMAAIAEAQAGNADKAIDIWKGILRADPESADAAAALRRLYTTAGKWNALLELLKEQVERVALPAEAGPARDAAVDKRISALLEVVAIYRDRLALPVMVINTYNAILALRPDYEPALSALASHYEATGRWNDLINVLQRTADGTAATDEGAAKKAQLLRRIAALWVDKFGNHNQAVKPLEELYALAPDDGEAAMRLRDIYGKRRAWKQLLDLERKELSRIAGRAERRQKLVEMAKLSSEKLNDPKEAISIWNLMLEDDADDSEALAALAALYDREKRYPALVEVLRRQRRLLGDVKAQVAMLEKFGTLSSDKLQAPALAATAYRDILAIQPNHPKAMRLLRELLVASGDFAGLERLYADHGTFEELCETLLAVAERHADPRVKLALNLRVAEIALRELKQPDRAVKAYERILASDADNQAAAEALVPLYRNAEKWPRLLAIYEILIGHAASDDARFELYRKVAELSESKLGSKQQAFVWDAKAYVLRPDDLTLEAELHRLAREADAFDELGVLLSEQLDKTADGERRIDRLRQLADLTLNRLGRSEEARGYYEQILSLVPGDLESLDALEKIHVQQGDHEQLLGVLGKRLQIIEEQPARIELLHKIAWIQEEQAGDLDAAAGTYQRVLEEDSQATRALRALERIYTARKHHDKLAEVVRRQLDAVDGDHEAEVDLAHRLGEIHELHLGQPEAALAHYERAFARQPGHKPTQAALERYLVEGSPSRVQVAKLLEPVYEASEEVEKQVGALRILLGASTDSEEELRLLRTLTQLTGRRLGDAEAAYGYAVRIFEKLPGDENARRELAELADVLDAHEDFANKLEAAESRVEGYDKSLARDLAWELGVLLEERLRQAARAEQAYLRVLSRDDRHEEALRALDRLYRGGERLKELRTLLVKRTELAANDAERRDLLFQVAELDEGLLDDANAAAGDYLRILDIEPNSNRAFKALERLYTRQSAWRELDGLYERISSHVESAAERADLKFRRGELHLTQLDDADAACDLFEEALAEDPRAEGARQGLERLLGRPALRLRVARLLEPLHANDENHEKLVQVLEAQREPATGRDAVDLLARIARLSETQLGDADKAFAAWREAFKIEPADEELAQNLERIGHALGLEQKLAETWEEGETLADPNDLELRRRFLEKAARLYDDPIADAGKAKAVWRRLLDLDPHHLETARPAADALARIYQDEEAWPELVEVLRQQATWAESEPDGDQDKRHFLRQAATVQEDLLQDFAAAIATHREILDQDPTDRASLDALERLHEVQDQYPELVEVLRRRVELSTDSTVRRNVIWRIAELTETKLTPAEGPHDDAIAAYAAILDEQPEDVPALDALARLHGKAERHTDLLDVLERRLAIATSGAASSQAVAAGGVVEERQDLRARIAALHEGPLGQLPLALDRYREMLQEDPDNGTARGGLERMLGDEDLRLTAAEVLEPVYQGRGETDRVIYLSELWAEHAPDLHERVSRLRKIASLKERNGDGKAAFEALSRAARLAVAEPELPSLLAELERFAHMGASREALAPELVSLYRELGADILDADVQERVYLTVAAQSAELGDRATAREYYRRVLDARPEHVPSLDALEALYREGGENEALAEIFGRRAELAGDDHDARRHYLLESARLSEGPLGRTDEAISAYEQVLELFPADVEAAQRLEALLTGANRFADLADLLERRMGFADDLDEAVALRVRLGNIYETHLEDRARAVENYRAALGGDPGNADAVAALERFLGDPDHRVEAAEVLEPVYAGKHDWTSLIRIYEIRLDATEEPARRLQLTRRIARLYEEQLEDLDGAFRWYGKVFREAPEDRSIREQLGRLANILGAHGQMADVYEEWLKDVYEETPASVEVLRTLAAIYDGRLNNPDKAKVAYQRLLAHDPTDAQAFALLESSLTRGERWTDLLSVYRDAADNAADVKKRKALLLKICNLQRNMLSDRDAAIDAWRQVLELDGDDPASAQTLDDLYTEGERWHDLVELLSRQLDRANPSRRGVVKLRLGKLYQEQLSDLPAAVDAYEEVINVDPENHEALSALEKLILERDVRFRIAEILEPIYKAHDEWAKLVVIYDAQLEFIDDKSRRVELLREMARLYAARGGNAERAFKALGRAWLEEAPEGQDREEPLYDNLYDFALQLGAFPQLIAILEKGIDGTFDDELRARVQARIAEVQEKHLRDPAAATESWRKVVAIHDEDVGAWRSLERLLAAQDRPGELVEVLDKRASLSEDVAEKKALGYRAADLYERVLSQSDQAIATWRNVLTLDEQDLPALTALERLYRQKNDLRELAWVYARQIELAETDFERKPLWFALAETQEGAGELSEAITAYKGVLDENPGDRDAVAALLRLYEREQLWTELLETLDLAAGLAASIDERGALRFRAARVLEDRQHDQRAAIDRYREILDEAPDHQGAREALEALLREEDTRQAAAEVLEPLYRRTGEHQPLIAVLEKRLSGEGDAGARRQLLGAVAELYEIGLDDGASAFQTWGRALAEDPTDPHSHDQLSRLAGQQGGWKELARLYAERLESVFEPDVQRLLSVKLATIHEDRLFDMKQAADHHRKALDLGGDELTSLSALDRLLSRELDHSGGATAQRVARELGDILEREAGAVQEASAQADLWYRLGELRRVHLKDADDALGAYREAIDRAPQHPAVRAALEAMLTTPQAAVVLDLLEPIYDADGDHQKRVRLVEVRLGLTKQPQARAELLQKIASIEENELGQPGGALDAMARALAETPEEPHLADEVERLGTKAGLLAQAAGALEKVLDQKLGAEAAREIGLRAARLFDQLHDDHRAEQRYHGVLEVDAENADALLALERIYRGQDNPALLSAILERRAGVELDPSDRKALLSEVALLREGPLADEPGAVEAWKQVLGVDETDGYALSALAALHEAAGRWAELVSILEQQARFVPDAHEQAAIKSRVATLHAERLHDLERAVEAWREVLDLLPDSLQALSALEELHGRRGDVRAVKDVLVQQLGVLAAGPDQVPVFRRLAALALEKLDNPDEAIGFYQSILDLQPDDENAIESLEHVLESQARWYDLVDTLKKHAELSLSMGEREREVALLVRAADVLEAKLESPADATDILETILTRDPSNLRALGSLAQIYEAGHDLERCKETLEKAAALGGDGGDAAQIQFHLGRIEDQLAGGGAGEHYYAQALDLDPTHRGALEALETLAREREQWSRVAELLALRAELSDEAVQKPLWLELARLHREKLGRPADALPALENARRLAPSDGTILDPLAEAYFAAGRLEEALPIYQGLIDATLAANKGRRTKELAKLHHRVGGIAEQVGDRAKALEQYNAAYAIDAGHPPTLAAIGRLSIAAGDWEKARRVFRSLLLQNLDANAGIRKAEVYLALGEIHEKTNEAPKAVGMYERGLELEPHNEVLKVALSRVKGAR